MAREDRWGWRIPIVALFVALASLAAAVAVATGWTRSTVLDTAGYVDALVAPLAADPDVKEAVANELARQMTAQVGTGIADSLTQWVPPSLPQLRAGIAQWADQLEQGWREQLRPTIRAQVDEPEFTSLWIEANRQAHRQFYDALTDAKTGAVVTINLRSVAEQAVRQTGVQIDKQFNLPNNIASSVYDSVAANLPPGAGIIQVDVSRIGQPVRTAVKYVAPGFFLSLGLVAVLVMVTLGTAPARRRGTALALLGVGFVLVAGGLWVNLSNAQVTAADKASSAAVTPLSADTRLIIDRQALLAVESFRGWATGLAGAGLAFVLVGGIWRIASGRSPDPAPTGGYGGGYGNPAGPSGYPPPGPSPSPDYGSGGGYPPRPAPGAYPPRPAPGAYPPSRGWDETPASPPWSDRPY